MKPNSKTHLSISMLEANVEFPAKQWLKPAEVSVMIGFDEKWLAAAREGLKGLDGPPFIKVGNGKTSPIRYPLDTLMLWMKSFPLQGVTTSNFSSFEAFRNSGSLSDVWPCVLYDDGSIDELFISMNNGRFVAEFRTRKIVWLVNRSIPKENNMADAEYLLEIASIKKITACNKEFMALNENLQILRACGANAEALQAVMLEMDTLLSSEQ